MKKKIEIDNRYPESEELRHESLPYRDFFSTVDTTFDLSQCQSFCDVGCATGWLLYYVKKRHPQIDVSGIEYFSYHKEASDHSIRENIHLFDIRDDIELLRQYKEHDVVVATEIGEHIEPNYTRMFLANLKKLMKENGLLVMTWGKTGGVNDVINDPHTQHLNPLHRLQFFELMKENEFVFLPQESYHLLRSSLEKNDFYFWWRESLSVWRKKDD